MYSPALGASGLAFDGVGLTRLGEGFEREGVSNMGSMITRAILYKK